MRSLITSMVLGLGVLGASAALPQAAQAAGPWHNHYYHGPYVRYYGPGFTYVPPVVAPAVIAAPVVPPAVVATAPIVEPAVVAPVAPYASFSVGWGPAWRGYYRGGWYHHHH